MSIEVQEFEVVESDLEVEVPPSSRDPRPNSDRPSWQDKKKRNRWYLRQRSMCRLQVVLALVFLMACSVHRAEFVYLHLTEPEPLTVERGKPPLDGYLGPTIPLSYLFKNPGGDFEVRLGEERFVPSIRILAPQNITKVEAGPCATVFGVSTSEVDVRWNFWRLPPSCVQIDEFIEVIFALEGSAVDIRMAGNFRQAGTIVYLDGL